MRMYRQRIERGQLKRARELLARQRQLESQPRWKLKLAAWLTLAGAAGVGAAAALVIRWLVRG